MNHFDLTGKHIAVTGASSGFGHHFAGVLAQAGARVSLGARRTDRIEGRVQEVQAQGGEAFGAVLDVSRAASVDGFIAAAEGAFGPIDVLINNAGVEAGAKTYTMIDETDWDRVLDTNLKGVWLASKAYTERVRGQRAERRQHHQHLLHHRSAHHQGPVSLCRFQGCTDPAHGSHGLGGG